MAKLCSVGTSLPLLSAVCGQRTGFPDAHDRATLMLHSGGDPSPGSLPFEATVMTRFLHLVPAACALALACGAASAQGRHLFDVDSGQSTITFGGTISAFGISGPIQGSPATVNISGAAEADVTVAGGAITAAQLVPGTSVVTVPPLSASVPGPFGPLATLSVTSVQVVFTSVDPTTLAPASFAVGGGGTFNASVVADVLSGTATINPLIGGQQIINLAGQQSTPQVISGTLFATANGFRLNVPIQTTFSFSDPGTGATGTLNFSGAIVGNDRALAADVPSISMSTGGTQTLTLSQGTAAGGQTYLVLGSISGTAPVITLFGANVPLNLDSYLILTATSPNMPPLGSSLGVLDSLGTGTTTFALPSIPPLAGLTFHHASVLVSTGPLSLSSPSNPVAVAINP